MIMKFRRSLDRKSDLVGPDQFDFHSSSRYDGESPPPTSSDSFGGGYSRSWVRFRQQRFHSVRFGSVLCWVSMATVVLD
ncbi:hypothetical protein Hdeb2414_s0007g00248121 [Helianthus debilis subsp. tardiflorus]